MRIIYFLIPLHFFHSITPSHEPSWPPQPNSADHHYYCVLHGIPGLNQDQIRAIVEGRMRLIPVAVKRIIPIQLLAMGALGIATLVSNSIQDSQKRNQKDQ